MLKALQKKVLEFSERYKIIIKEEKQVYIKRFMWSIVFIMLFSIFTLSASTTSVTIIQGSEPESLDPTYSGLTVDMSININYAEPLVVLSPEGDYNPWLAESWGYVSNNHFRVYLRKNVLFHNGQQMTAEDVKFSLERIVDPDFGSKLKGLPPLSSVEVVDDFTVDIVLKEPYGPMLPSLVLSRIVPKSVVEELGDEAFAANPMGTGPFRFVEWVRGVRVKLEAFDDYWGGRPEIDQVIFKAIPEEAVRFAELKTGRADIVVGISPDSAVRGPGYRILTTPSPRQAFLALNTWKPPFDELKIRLALNYAINKESLVENLLAGYGTVSSCWLTPGWEPEYDPDRPPYSYDPEKARQLIKESGYDEIPIELLFPIGRYPKDKEISQSIAFMLEDVGFRVTLDGRDPLNFSQVVFRELAMENAGFIAFGGKVPDSSEQLGYYYNPGVSERYYSNEELFDLVREQFVTLDTNKRSEILKKIDIHLYDNAVRGFLFAYNSIYGISEKINWNPGSDELIRVREIKLR